MPNKIDIFDKNNQPTGRQATIDHALKRGLWHRGVHVIVVTKSGYVLVQKRSNSMRMHPGYLDISCGGFVDGGEDPQTAAIRELNEELGIAIRTKDLHLLSVKRKNHAWRRIKRHSRAFIYCYAAYLPDHNVDLSHLQTAEVQWAGFVSFGRALRLVRLHHLKGLGRIEPLYGFYTYLLRTSRQGLQVTE